MEKSSTTTESSLPLVALIGPTNSGKSTLFNRLTGSWQAITAKEESTTRDRVYGEVEWQGCYFNLIDTGGLVDDDSLLTPLIFEQMIKAANEADLILFIYDAATGLSDKNAQFLNGLRGKYNVWLVANKVDSINRLHKLERLEQQGLPYHEVSATSGRGTGDLLEAICQSLPQSDVPKHSLPVIALVGRPNVGKSTLLNCLTNSDRAVVSPIAGTTRDIVSSEIIIDDKKYLLADTAGVRRRGKIDLGPESFSVKRTLTAISSADMVLVLIDATAGSTRGDLHLLYYARQLEKSVLMVINKTDLTKDKPIQTHGHVGRFDSVLISAKKGEGTDQILNWIKEKSAETTAK